MAHEREVLIRLKLVDDKGSAAALTRQAKTVEDVQKKVGVSHAKAIQQQQREEARAEKESIRRDERQFNARMKTIKERERAVAAAAREEQRIQARSVKETEKAESEKQRAAGRTLQEEQRAQARSIRETVKAERQKQTAQARTIRELEHRHARLFTANLRLGQSVRSTMQGVLRLGRGIALLGIVGEKDTEKLLRALVKVQAVFDLIRGAIHTWSAIARMIRYVEVATKAATAAQLAYNVAAGVGAAGAGAGVGGAMLKGAGAVGGAALLTKGLAMGAAVLPPVAAGAGAGAAVTSAVLTGREAYKYGIGGGATPGSAVETYGTSSWNPFAYLAVGEQAREERKSAEARRKRMTERRFGQFDEEGRLIKAGTVQIREREEERQADQRRYTESVQDIERRRRESDWEREERMPDPTGTRWKRRLPQMEQAYTVAQRERIATEADPQKGNLATIAALEKEAQALGDVISVYDRERLAVLEVSKAKMAAHQRTIADLTAEAEKHKDVARTMREAQMSGLLRFALKTPGERRRIEKASERLKAGTATPEDIKLLGEMADIKPIQKKREEWAEKEVGEQYGRVTDDYQGKVIRDAGDLARRASQGVRVERNIVFNLEHSQAALETEINAKLKPLMDEQDKRLKEAAQLAMDEAMERRNAQNAAAAGPP